MSYFIERSVFTDNKGKEHPMVCIREDQDSKFSIISMGRRKCRAVVDCIEELKKFLEEGDKPNG